MVYVDNFKAPLGRMLMCHMIADSKDELLGMADIIGVPRKHIQNEGKYNEHFDISLVKRKMAIAAGATAIDTRQLVNILKKRPNHPYFNKI